MLTGRLLHVFLSRLKLPLVISEIIGGIILGPSLFGRIPGFQQNLFPLNSIATLDLVANIGLMFFLYTIGLELDLSTLKSSARKSLLIASFAIIIPFIFGIPLSYGIYVYLNSEETTFPTLLLFIGVAFGITAFPVLARILSDFNLLSTPVGVSSISAAALVDILGWCLLALVVSLVKTSEPLSTVYLFLVVLLFIIIMLFAVRPLMFQMLRRSKAFEGNITEFGLFLAFFVALVSGFTTDTIGIHAIFGGFLAGLVTPRKGAFSLQVRQQLENFTSIIFLPVYFALSGLKTDISYLNNAVSWGFFFLIFCIIASSKILGTSLAARLCKFSWRESFAIGIIMDCRGLMDLIVLNIGLDNHVIDKRVFTLMVLMALMATLITSILIQYVYPSSHHSSETPFSKFNPNPSKDNTQISSNFSIVLLFEHIHDMPRLVKLIETMHVSNQDIPDHSLTLYPIKLIERSHLGSSLFTCINTEEFITHDSLLTMLDNFGRYCNFSVRNDVRFIGKSDIYQNLLNQRNIPSTDLSMLIWEICNPSSNLRDTDDTTQDFATIDFYKNLLMQSYNDSCIYIPGFATHNHENSNNHVASFTEAIVFNLNQMDDEVSLMVSQQMTRNAISCTLISPCSPSPSIQVLNDSTFRKDNELSSLDINDPVIIFQSLLQVIQPLSQKELLIIGRYGHLDTTMPECLRKNGLLPEHFNKDRSALVGVLGEVVLCSKPGMNLLIVKSSHLRDSSTLV